MGLITVTEYIFVYVSSSLGIILCLGSALAIYGLLSALDLSEALTDVLENVSLLFIYTMLISSLPWFFFKQSLMVPAVYSLVLALCSWRIHSRKLSLEYLGLVWKNLRNNSLTGLVLGIPTGVLEYVILRPLPATPAFNYRYFIQTAVYMFLFVALGEELLFRALIQNSTVKLVGALPGIFWSAVIFAVMHTVWRSVSEIFFTFGAGLLLGVLYHKTDSLVGPILLHGVNNVLLLAVMPYLVWI